MAFPEARILRVNLANGQIGKEIFSAEQYRLYPGGSALAAYFLLKEMEKGARFETIRRFGTLGVSALLALGALFVLLRIVSRLRATASAAPAAVAVEEGAGFTIGRKGKDVQTARVERQLRQIASQPPDVVAGVVRAWLREP